MICDRISRDEQQEFLHGQYNGRSHDQEVGTGAASSLGGRGQRADWPAAGFVDTELPKENPRVLLAGSLPARLIPPGNIPTVPGTGDTRATFSAINLPAVAASADQHLAPATLAEKEASGIVFICSMAAVMTWTRSSVCAIITRHSCSARCRARRRVELAVRSALCLPSSIFTKITAGAATVPVLTPSPKTPPAHFSTTVHSMRWKAHVPFGRKRSRALHSPVSAAEGWIYVAAVIDLFSRRIIG